MTLLALLRAQWDRVLGRLLVVGGLVGVVAGLITIAGSGDNPKDQLSFLASGVIGGLFSIGLGGCLLVSARLQDRWRRVEKAEPATAVVIEPEALGTTYSGRGHRAMVS